MRAQDCHQAIAKKCRDDSCFEMKELAAFCSQAHVSKLKKRCQLLNCVQVPPRVFHFLIKFSGQIGADLVRSSNPVRDTLLCIRNSEAGF